MKPSDPPRNVVVTFLWLGCFTLSALGQTILLANRKDIQVIDTSGVGRKANVSSRVLVPNLEDAISVDYHFRRKLVCWGDRNLAMIGCARLEVSPSIGLTVVESFKVIPKKVAPDGIAVDWINDKIYWTDTEANTIEVCNLDGSKRRTLYWKNVRQARAIAVVPSEGLLFWTEWTEKAKIERAGMHGDDKSRLVLEEDRIFWPNALTIDYHSELIYWADAKLQFIASMDYDGKRKRYFGEHKLKHPFAITFYRGKLFWSDWELSAVQTCDVASQCDKPRNLLSWKDPMDLQVWEQQPWSESPCHLRNGGCSDLCLAAPPLKRFVCACPTGVRMLNETTCDTGYKKFLILARRPELRVISFDTAEKMSIVLPVSNLASAKVVEFDPVEQRVYWIEGNFRSIRSASLDGGSEKYLTPSNLDMPEDIALDWVGRNLYWTDSGTKKISVTRLDGSTSIDLITTHLSDPRAVTLDVLGGWMFWSDWGEKPKIERAYMNGEARQLLIDDGLGWPGGITLDTSTQRVYWIDAKYDHLEVMNYDGTRRTVFITELPHPYSLTILGNFLYWTDWQRRSVEKADKASGKVRSVVLDQLPDVMGVKGVDMSSWSPSSTKCSRNNGGCSHFCLNRRNGLEPVCVCPPGYTLASNGVCSPPSAYLIYSCRYDIQTISLADFSHSIVPLSGIEDAGSLDYFYAEERIFWADTKIGAISRAFFNGSDSRRIVEVGVKYLEGMAVDWISQNIYWADLGSHRIEMARLDGSSRKVLIWKDIESPRSLAVNPLHGYLYWSEWSEHKPRIERATLDGAKRTTIVDNVGRSNGLTVNYEERRLYWTDVDGKQIESADLNGRNRRTILAEGLIQPFGMTMFGDYLYWTDIEKDSVERASKDGRQRLTVKSNLTYPLDILVYHPTRQQGTNACAFDDGECSHLCVPEPRDSLEASDEPMERVCTCPTHYKLAQPGGTKCQGPSSFLLFSQTDRISRLVMDTDDCPDIILPIRALEDVLAVAYDQRAKLVYWIDGNSSTIRYSAEDDTHGKDFLDDSYMYEPFDVVYEPLTDLVFWSCSRRDVINVTRASDRHPIGVIVGDSDGYVQKPRSLAVHSARGLLFWTDLAAPGFIRRCNLDGSNGSIVVKEDLHQPTAMTVDQRDDLIFWADAEQRRIEMATIDGHNRAVLVGQGIFAPQSLAVLGDYLYWVDSDEQNLERVHKTSNDKDESVAVLSRLSDLTDIVSIELLPQKLLDASPCRSGMNRCSHLCLVDFNFAAEFVRGTATVTKKRLFWNHRCACPRGLMLDSDGFTCVRVVPCRADYFACSSGDCVPQVRRCDGKNDCLDGSDESNCSECEGDWFRCRDGTCLDPVVVCDELSDCADGSDEGPGACEAKNPLVNPPPPAYSGGIPAGATPAAAAIPPAQGSSKSPLFTIVICICIVVLISVFILAYYCRRNSTSSATPARQEVTNGGTVLGATTGVPGAAGSDLRSRGTGRSQTSLNSCVTYSVLLQNSNGAGVGAVAAATAAATAQSTSSYDRNHVTGASSSSSSGGAVAPSGPPPSPASAVKLPYHSRALIGRRNRGDAVVPVVGPPPPPTTPCTTDACDESDCTVGKYYELDPPPPTPARWHGHGHGHGHGHHGHGMGLSDASDCPASPATERSFFNPQPPPPSPEPSSQQPFLPRS